MVFPTEVAFLEPTAADDAATRWDGVGPVSVTTGDATTAIDPATSDDGAADASRRPRACRRCPRGTAVTRQPGARRRDRPATGAPVVVYDPTTGLPITGYDANRRPITLLASGGAGATSTRPVSRRDPCDPRRQPWWAFDPHDLAARPP
ncbi:MAG: hypothetical protein R2699_13805 [Acidimicrobiales bacterium]